MIEVVSLDFGGTIAYEVGEDHVLYYNVLRELGYTISVDLVKRGLVEAKGWWRREKTRTGRVWCEEAYVEFVERFFSSIGLPVSRSLALKVVDLLPRRVAFRAYDDVEPALRELRERGFRLIVISNVSSLKNLSIYLTRIGLMEYFELLVASGSVGYEKPKPRNIQTSIESSEYPSP